jgi:cell wall-associated NlpC family hydrolase
MKKHFPIAVLISISLLFLSLAHAQEPKANGRGIISVPLANVHEAPLPKSRLATQVLMGDEVRILEKQDYRYHIAIPSQNDREGWIQQEAVLIPRDKNHASLNGSRKKIVITRAKTEALILDKTGDHNVPLYAGTQLPVVEQTSKGYKVQFPDHTLAIIEAAAVMPVKTSDPIMNDTTTEEIVRTAQQFVGVNHQAGGLTSQGMDTDGLIYLVYRIHGIALGTDRAAFKAHAERVDKKDIQAGDILVFSGENHGFALGSGRFLQATKKRTIQAAGMGSQALQYGLRVIGAEPGRNKVPAAMTADEILLAQARTARLPLNKRIVYWAGRFIGTPYDPDPLGLYVRTNRIVADEKVDCMYHAFRSVELAQSGTPFEAINQALTLRFITRGTQVDGLVTNYDQRYQYGEDMVFSGKFGKNVTADLGATKAIPGSRGRDTVDILPKSTLLMRGLQKNLQDGDLIYWVKDPKKRGVEEIVAHLSIVHIKGGKPYLIHAAGDKDRADRPGGGVVKEVPFATYVQNMRFIGAFVTRFEQEVIK